MAQEAPAKPMDAGNIPSQRQASDAVAERLDAAGGLAGAVSRVLINHRPALIVLAAAIAVRAVQGGWFGADVSWLMTLGQSYLAGHSPYHVFFEVNPPGSILLYLPAIVIGRAVGLMPETVLNALLIAAGALSAMVCARMVARTGVMTAHQARLFEAVVVFVLLIAPCGEFGQREHIAAIALLPAISLYALRISGGRAGLTTQILAGLAAGVGVAIKPHFALALLLPFAFLIFSRPMTFRARAKLVLMPEHIFAFCVLAAYLAVALIGFPDYFSIALPRALRVYEPVFVKPLGMLVGLTLLGIETAFIAALAGRAMLARVPAIFALAAGGFALAMVLQFKGWPYHSLPAFLLLNITFALIVLPRASELWEAARRPANRIVAIMLAVLGVALVWRQLYFASSDDDVVPGLLPALARLAPPHPKLMSISRGSIGFPLVHKLDGRWVGPTANAWVPNYANYLIRQNPSAATRRALEGDVRWYWRATAADIRTRHPDAVLIESRYLARKVAAHPKLVWALRGYRKAETVSDVAIWVPRNPTHGGARRRAAR